MAARTTKTKSVAKASAARATKSATKKAAKAPAKVAAKATGKIDTVTLRHIGAALAEKHNLPKKQANEVLSDMVSMITTHLKKGARLRLGGLGVLQVRKRPARDGRNPATGEKIRIKASKKVAFRPAKELKEAV